MARPHPQNRTEQLAAAHAMEAPDVLAAMRVDAEQGLAGEEIAPRLARYGANQLREVEDRSPWEILLAQLESIHPLEQAFELPRRARQNAGIHIVIVGSLRLSRR